MPVFIGKSGQTYLEGWNTDDQLLFFNDESHVMYGHGGKDYLLSGDGYDWMNGGDGNDVIEGSGGGDHIDGGDGYDTAAYRGSPVGVFVSLQDGTAMYGDAEGDKLRNIEVLWGSQFADHLYGDDAHNGLAGFEGNDRLWGNGGNDVLSGDDGNDYLSGGTGTDRLYGGTGDDVLRGGMDADLLYGNAGADLFVWSDPAETGVNGWVMDSVMDFNRAEGDLIDLRAMDANETLYGRQSFNWFIGTAAFSGAPGELRYYHADGYTYIEMNTDASADVDGTIRLVGAHVPDHNWFLT